MNCLCYPYDFSYNTNSPSLAQGCTLTFQNNLPVYSDYHTVTFSIFGNVSGRPTPGPIQIVVPTASQPVTSTLPPGFTPTAVSAEYKTVINHTLNAVGNVLINTENLLVNCGDCIQATVQSSTGNYIFTTC